MKSRVSFVLSKTVLERLNVSSGNYRKSAIIEGIIKDYIEAKDYAVIKPIERLDPIIVSFTIDFELLQEFRKCYPVSLYNRRHGLDRPRLSESIEYLLKIWLENNRVG